MWTVDDLHCLFSFSFCRTGFRVLGLGITRAWSVVRHHIAKYPLTADDTIEKKNLKMDGWVDGWKGRDGIQTTTTTPATRSLVTRRTTPPNGKLKVTLTLSQTSKGSGTEYGGAEVRRYGTRSRNARQRAHIPLLCVLTLTSLPAQFVASFRDATITINQCSSSRNLGVPTATITSYDASLPRSLTCSLSHTLRQVHSRQQTADSQHRDALPNSRTPGQPDSRALWPVDPVRPVSSAASEEHALRRLR
ncbi:hypothetical protein L226DRAFT_39771 [Lentinus tigrinus ALCF2SS1-7]|uniref:Uncharacterized protein n=1 Tax=Lentinus tigrinus ALCF2SS1-6 TaxID=1328759 RepID=A0A5C2SMU2_9APHY|nr:hypothetical protein L227DRAFT_262764 [Lentinus tigrinus ALCF2SS1-6]RPD82878.1 hypothetical protein L226DRAFT_39771 [Lentinus tigrinus ALCF2SS1-7]